MNGSDEYWRRTIGGTGFQKREDPLGGEKRLEQADNHGISISKVRRGLAEAILLKHDNRFG